jgi:tripartite-type tricarboxylate transporter receptor subunit TctC
MLHKLQVPILIPAALAVVGFTGADDAQAQWKPTKTVEFIVPAGTGGGADQMARMIQGVIQKHNLMEQSLVVVNKAGGSGGEGFLDVKDSAGNPHKIIITLSSLFTTPLATGIPFSWEDLTPVSMLALDEFVLWVNAKSPYMTAEEYINAAKAADGQFAMAGTGSKQEDQIITVGLEQATGVKLKYISEKGGGDVAKSLVGNHVNSTVNNPIEQVSFWKAGETRALCVFDIKRIELTEKVTADMAWSDIPTCKEAGLDIEYTMLRGIFMPAGVEQAAVDYYIDLFSKVRETPEWKEFMAKGAYQHKDLMTKAGFISG